MASEYLKQKYKDVKPDTPREMTEAERRKNWWYYHKWHVVAAVVAALAAADLVWSMLGRGTPQPDYQIAYVGEGSLPGDTAAAIEAGFASLGEDLNGDGQVLVKLRQYVSNPEGDPDMFVAASVQLMSDIMEQESFFFLLEDPEQFQENYHTLSRLDGSLPERTTARWRTPFWPGSSARRWRGWSWGITPTISSAEPSPAAARS